MKIDAHQHFWDLDRGVYPWLTKDFGSIYRTIEPPELEPFLEEAGIDKTILVQAMDSYDDTHYMLEIADEYDWVGGVVGWVPLNLPEEADKKLIQFKKHPLFKGVRHLINEEADPDWVIKDNVIEGLKVLASHNIPFDYVDTFPNNLKHIPTILEKVPDLRILIDHLGKPVIKEQKMEPWASMFAKAATYPQVYAKVSGLNTAAGQNWSAKDLEPYIDFAMEHFGANRLIFGSDWPVANLAGNYMKVWDETNKVLKKYTDSEVEAILGGTAKKFYDI